LPLRRADSTCSLPSIWTIFITCWSSASCSKQSNRFRKKDVPEFLWPGRPW
jgi:hypothetical protein